MTNERKKKTSKYNYKIEDKYKILMNYGFTEREICEIQQLPYELQKLVYVGFTDKELKTYDYQTLNFKNDTFEI